MKSLKTVIRIWIATTSVAGFLGGWTLLAHSGKPAPLQEQPAISEPATLPTLAPLPPIDNPSSSLQPLPALPQVQMSFPRMRTRGS